MNDYSKKSLLREMKLQKNKLLQQQKLLNKLNEKLNEERKKIMDSEMKITMLNRPKLKFNNCNLKKIINVYQPKYRNHTCQGFGDFLRGSFFLVQFCLYNKIQFDMNYNNHSISKYIKNNTPLKYDIKHDEVDYYHPDNICSSSVQFYYEFNKFMNNQKKNTLCAFFNNVPIFKIGDKQRNIIKNKFLPSDEVIAKVNENLASLGFKEKQFSVIHIRSGDEYIKFNKKGYRN